MTYASFLIGFILLPIIILLLWLLYKYWRGSWRPDLIGFSPSISFPLLSAIAVLYTTPWDNYLVATRVWWYDPARVLGITIGWVPIEEYLFFMLQPVLGGLILLYLFSRRSAGTADLPSGLNFRRWSLAIALTIWVAGLIFLLAGMPDTTYLGLELVWALPVVILQLAFGADIFWRHRSKLILLILGLTIYLSLADALAIEAGVWTINPQKSLGVLVGGILPVEEFVFFLLTNTMVGFGFVLIWSPESRARLRGILGKINSVKQDQNLSEEI
jgi:lycopene cyclase domain-containing protein